MSVMDLIEAGRHGALIGEAVPEGPSKRPILRVRCDGTEPYATWGAIAEALRGHVAEGGGALDHAARRMASVQRRLLGGRGDKYHDVLDLHAARWPAPAIVLEGAERMDEASLAFVGRAVEAEEIAPIIVHWNVRPTRGPAALLLKALDGERAESSAPPAPLPAPPPADTPSPPFRPGRIHRAAAVLGPRFTASILAQATRTDVITVMEALQEAADAGVPVVDHGDAIFSVDPTIADGWAATTLPSLAAAWRAAAEAEPPEPVAPPASTAFEVSNGAVSSPNSAPTGDPPPDPIRAPERADADASTGFEPAQGTPTPGVETPEHPRQPDATGRRETDPSLRRTRAGAATTARRLVDAGRPDAAANLLRRAIAAADRDPTAPALERARLVAALGRTLWEGAGRSDDFSLPAALSLLDLALRALPADAPASDRAEIRELIAAVCTDTGDRGPLDRALDELATASRELMAAGDPRAAARLLNDQAAVWLKTGDPVRAAHLLRESRKVFGAAEDAPGRTELAETEHLLATLPLHVAARAGAEQEAILAALEHAATAESVYHQLGQSRPAARVWETRGRLLALLGRHEEAAQSLSRAHEAQRALGDLIGLARTTEALASLLGADGRVDDAATLLLQAAQLDAMKGSAAGLATVRAAASALLRATPREHPAFNQVFRLGQQLDLPETRKAPPRRAR